MTNLSNLHTGVKQQETDNAAPAKTPLEIRDRLHAERSRFRTKRLLFAIGTSLVAKVSGLAVVLIAFPVAVSCLGNKYFVLYSMIASLLAWISLGSIGVGPAMTVAMAAADSNSDRAQQASIFSSLFFPISMIAVPSVIALFVLISLLPVQNMFGDQYYDDRPVIVSALLLLTLLFFFNAVLSVVESAQLGFQEQHYLNVRTVLANIFACCAILLMPRILPTVLGLLLALQIPTYVTRLLNAGYFFYRRSFLLPKWSKFSWSVAKPLVRTGIIFLATGTIGNFLCHYFPIIIAGRSYETDAAATFAAVMNLILLTGSVIAMVTIPMRSSISDAITRNDLQWTRKAIRNTFIGGLGFSALFGLSIVLFGQTFFRWWLGDSIVPTRPLLFAAGAYFCFMTGENLCVAVLIGDGRIAYASIICAIRAVLVACVLLCFQQIEAPIFPFFVLSISVAFVSLPLLMKGVIAVVTAPASSDTMRFDS